MKELSGSVEQAALAQDVASELNIAVGMEYAEDPSGTVGVIKATKSYTDNAVVVTMSYTAPNGNYRAVQQW